jgi:curved DNA-binding protein
MEYKDYYKTLGVPKTATPADIKKAYRRLARELHPDRNPGDKTAEKRFKDVNEANEVLGDPQKRRQYDTLGANWDQFARAGAGAAGGNPFGQGNPFGPGGPFAGFGGQGGNVRYEFHTVGGQDASDFSDFFNMFFGGGMPMQEARAGAAGAAGAGAAGSAGAASGRGRGGRGNPLEDLLSRLRSDQTQSGGRGRGGGGSGRGRTAARGEDVQAEVEVTLEEAFSGSTRLVQAGGRRLEVKVPRGVETGSKIRLRGKAGDGADAGDLYLVIKVRPHPAFSRSGADLTREVPITLGEALLGGEVDVPTLDGRVLLRIPPGTQPGQTFRLTGKGMPRLKGEGSGDLLAKTKVVLPGRLEGRQRKAAEDFVKTVDQPNPRQH